MICGWQELAASDKRWTVHPLMEEMKAKAKTEGLWNLWISPDLAANIRPALPEGQDAPDTLLLGAGLSNLVKACSYFMSPMSSLLPMVPCCQPWEKFWGDCDTEGACVAGVCVSERGNGTCGVCL